MQRSRNLLHRATVHAANPTQRSANFQEKPGDGWYIATWTIICANSGI